MRDVKRTKYILHVSDFHLTQNSLDFAKEGLKALSDMLDKNDITVDYLIHTGDIIDSSCICSNVIKSLADQDAKYSYITEKYITKSEIDTKGFLSDPNTTEDIINQINNEIREAMSDNYLSGLRLLFDEFIADICVRKKHTFFCIGNHDALRPFTKEGAPLCDRFLHDDGNAANYHEYLQNYEKENRLFDPILECFIRNFDSTNVSTRNGFTQTADLNLVILNTNHRNPKKSKEGYYCIDCANATKILNSFNTKEDKRLNIVVAHKPIYEICEAARMSFSNYHKTEFLTAIHNFVGENGIYICGDKHTRSVSDSTFHSIQHIIGGAPLLPPKNGEDFHVEYNLIETTEGKVGNIQKIHLFRSGTTRKWDCLFRPEDSIVERLYELSGNSVIPQCLSVLTPDSRKNSWTDISRIFYKEKGNDPKWAALEDKLDQLYHIICKCGQQPANSPFEDSQLNKWDEGTNSFSIFQSMQEYLNGRMNNPTFSQANILNIRGEYSSGKSTFLGILYIYLLFQYSIGNISFIPAYFNFENKEILRQINNNSHNDKITYYRAATNSFNKFVYEVQQIANKSHQSVCYLIDGLDEQDVWSYSSEDSVGRGILDILDGAKNSKNVISYSQHHLPLFKNTMPERKYKDYSDVLYFNNVNIVSADSQKGHFQQFISSFYSLQPKHQTKEHQQSEIAISDSDSIVNARICKLIQKFRRLTVGQNFLYRFSEYIVEKAISKDTSDSLSIDEVYRNYIDLLHKMCIDTLGYGYVHYAPAMAYLFSFKGFTYERFKRIPPNSEDYWQKKIAEYSHKVYDAFIFIKKNQDIREYLVAMHYNRELRFYAENPEIPISEASILNEFISRNIAIISRKMWKSDPNKFVIVCVELLEKRRELGQSPICNNALSMLIYTLAHQEKMYAPNNTMLDRIISSYETETGRISNTPNDNYCYRAHNTDKLQQFLDYGLYRSYRLYKAVSEGNSEELALSIIKEKEFARYNRQYLRLYYGDLTISGENRKAPLSPGEDTCLKGFDFHNTFNLISEKLRNIGNHPYALMAYDLFSLCDLIQTRLEAADNSRQNPGTFFSGKKNTDTQVGVLQAAIDFINAYNNLITGSKERTYYKELLKFQNTFNEAISIRKQQAKRPIISLNEADSVQRVCQKTD